MAIYAIEDAEAFALLRGVSNRHNVKVRDLAQKLLEVVSRNGRRDSVLAAETDLDVLAAVLYGRQPPHP